MGDDRPSHAGLSDHRVTSRAIGTARPEKKLISKSASVLPPRSPNPAKTVRGGRHVGGQPVPIG